MTNTNILHSNYTFETSLNHFSDDDLNAALEFNHKAFGEVYEKQKAIIVDIIREYLPDWKVDYLNKEVLNIRRPSSERSNLDIDIYYGIDIFGKKDFKFEINPASVGTFNICGTSDEKAYYAAIGVILTNGEFQDKLYKVLFNLASQTKNASESMININYEINRRQQVAKREAEHEAMVKETIEIKPSFIGVKEAYKAKDWDNIKYALIWRNIAPHLANATYRNQPVRVLLPADKSSVLTEIKFNEYRYTDDVKVVDAHLIKFII